MTALLRLAGLPAQVLDTTGHVWWVLENDPAAARAVAIAGADVLADIEQRLAAGQRWRDKRLRQRADYLWRLLGRAAFKPVPRDWLSHVASVPVCDSDATTLLAGDLTAHGHVAHHVENVCQVRGDGTRLGLTGLHRFDDGHLSFHAGERHVRLRITPAMRAVCDVLHDGTAHVDAVRKALREVTGSAVVADGFLARLETIGLVERSRRPASRLVVNAEPGTGHPHSFTDVYRTVRAVVPTTSVSRVRHATTTLARVGSLLLDDALPQPDPIASLITEEPRALPELVDALTTQGFPPRSRGLHWRPAATPASAYAALLAHLEHRVDDPVADIGTALLDELGARPSTWDWPVDVLLRPLPGTAPLGVLEAVTPAGVLDARFAEGLTTWLAAEPAHITEYRRFLQTAARNAEPVEVLIPALSEPGANSVRRPRYTGRWTGDPGPAAYWPDWTGGTGHLPLRDITIRHANGRVVTESGGREVWLLHHATRAPHGAWRHLAGLLRHAFPRRPLPAMEFGGLLGAFPHHDHAPRVTVDGEVVVSCAQWRWHDRDIAALRDRGAPRWVFARAGHGGKPLPVDLDGPTAGRLLDRLGRGPLLVEEMLPGPDRLVIQDNEAASGLCAQLQLRLYP